MKDFFTATALQSAGALVAIESIPMDVVPTVGYADIKNQVVAIGASIVVSVVRWAFLKYVRPIFVKKKIDDIEVNL